MSGLIGVSSSGSGGNKYNKLIISDFKECEKPTPSSISISYIAINNDNKPLQHFIIVDGIKQEITSYIDADKINREFTYKIENLKLGTSYNLQIEITDGIDAVQSIILTLSTSVFKTIGVRVDESNQNPETCCTYIDNATGISPATATSLGEWENRWPFNKIRIVGFKSGKVIKEIKKEDKTKYIDGTNVPTDVDVMVEIPKIYWNFTDIENGYELKISNEKINNTYDCYAHKVGDIEKDFIYVGAYLGSLNSQYGTLKSIGDVMPINNKDLYNLRQYAYNNGKGYQLFNWFTFVLLQILYLIAYKNLNSQKAIGMGYTCGNSTFTKTGWTKDKGFVYGEQTGKEQMCFLGIEDLWGNMAQWIDGIFFDNRYDITVTPDNKTFNDRGTGYKTVYDKLNTYFSGYISKTSHTNESGFFPVKCIGSNTTYYCGNSVVVYGYIAYLGAYYNSSKSSNIFSLNLNSDPSRSNYKTSRLCYLGE